MIWLRMKYYYAHCILVPEVRVSILNDLLTVPEGDLFQVVLNLTNQLSVGVTRELNLTVTDAGIRVITQ